MLYTLRDMSGLFADREQRPEEPIFNQLKGLTGRNVLQAVSDRYGKKGALLFPRSEVFRARMLAAALDAGFTSEKLAKFDAHMRAETRWLDPITGRQHSYSFDKAATDLEAAYYSPETAKMWVFVVGRVRVGGDLEFSGHWTANGISGGTAPDWSEPRHGFEGVSTFAFTNLCAPLLGALMSEG